MQYFLVGGAVRDQLLHKPSKDRDWVVVGATEKQMLDLNFKQVGKDFPVFLHPETKEEYALARTEVKDGSGYYGFRCAFTPDVTLEQDLLRRDLSINAMAMSESGELIDPYGGYDDLKAGRLRHVSDAFIEDPLRVLRVARFLARYHQDGFQVAAETMELMRKLSSSGELEHLTTERVWQELERALGEPSPWMFFSCLQSCGALARLFPELLRGFTTSQNEKQSAGQSPTPKLADAEKQARASFTALEAIAAITAERVTRFAALCNEIYQKESLSAAACADAAQNIGVFCRRLKSPRSFLDLASLTRAQLPLLMTLALDSAEDILELFERSDAFRKPDRFHQFLVVASTSLQCWENQHQGLHQAPINASIRQVSRVLPVVLKALQTLNYKKELKPALSGSEIKEMIRNKRLARIREALL